jgi:hypothetical protein
MSGPHLTMVGLMVVVLIVGLDLAALRSPTGLWASALFTMTSGLLVAAILGIVYRRGPRRAFWLGFALFGWTYLLVSDGPWFSAEVQPVLLTTRLIEDLYPRLHPPPTNWPPPQLVAWNPLGSPADFPDSPWTVNHPHFRRIGHAVAAQLVAVLGGVLACLFEATRTKKGARDRGGAGDLAR